MRQKGTLPWPAVARGRELIVCATAPSVPFWHANYNPRSAQPKLVLRYTAPSCGFAALSSLPAPNGTLGRTQPKNCLPTQFRPFPNSPAPVHALKPSVTCTKPSVFGKKYSVRNRKHPVRNQKHSVHNRKHPALGPKHRGRAHLFPLNRIKPRVRAHSHPVRPHCRTKKRRPIKAAFLSQGKTFLESVVYTSSLAYLALRSMKSRRGATSSPISIENRWSASAADSTVTCFSVRVAGCMVVVQSCSAFISPSPL
jgi:hypothetical protein